MPRIANVGRIDWALNGSEISFDRKPLITKLLPGDLWLWSVSTIRLELEELPRNCERETGFYRLYGKIIPPKNCPPLAPNSRDVQIVNVRDMRKNLKIAVDVSSILAKECAAIFTVHPYAAMNIVYYEMAFLNRSNDNQMIRNPTDYMIAIARKIGRYLKQSAARARAMHHHQQSELREFLHRSMDKTIVNVIDRPEYLNNSVEGFILETNGVISDGLLYILLERYYIGATITVRENFYWVKRLNQVTLLLNITNHSFIGGAKFFGGDREHGGIGIFITRHPEV